MGLISSVLSAAVHSAIFLISYIGTKYLRMTRLHHFSLFFPLLLVKPDLLDKFLDNYLENKQKTQSSE